MKSYVNCFDGYTTAFYVPDDPSQEKECVIRFVNISPIEIVIPYATELTPTLFRESLQALLERMEDITYEEYPFRSERMNSKEVVHVRVYFHTIDSNVRIQVNSYASEYSVAFEAGCECIMERVREIEANMISILNSMKY